MCRRLCVGVTVIVFYGGMGVGWFYAQNQPFKTEFPSITALQLFRIFSSQIALSNLFS